MKLREGYFANLIEKYSQFDNEVHIIVSALRSSDEAYIIMKPSIAPLNINGITRYVVLPPLTVITPKPLENATHKYYQIMDECWVDGKLLLSNDLSVIGAGLIKDALNPVVQLMRKRTTSVKVSECLLIDSNSKIPWNEYLSKTFHTKHIILLNGLTDSIAEHARGLVWYLWRTHPVLYGLKPPINILEATIVRNIPEKLMVLSKPLIFLGNYVLVSEISYNGSIVITGVVNDEIMKALALRALLYVC